MFFDIMNVVYKASITKTIYKCFCNFVFYMVVETVKVLDS